MPVVLPKIPKSERGRLIVCSKCHREGGTMKGETIMENVALAQKTPTQITTEGLKALQQLKALVMKRPEKDKLVINGKQYLFFPDWQLLGLFFGITASVVDTKEITREIPGEKSKASFIETIGFHARAVALQNGKEISAAEAECLKDEENWSKKARFQLLSMAQTRACAKALRNCLQWVVRLPTSNFAEETAEEVPPESVQGVKQQGDRFTLV
jgi:hypothetical protein